MQQNGQAAIPRLNYGQKEAQRNRYNQQIYHARSAKRGLGFDEADPPRS